MTAAGAARLGHGTLPPWLVGEGVLYFDQADGMLYFRRSDTGAVVGPLGGTSNPPGKTISATTYTALLGDNGVVIRFTSPTGCVVTVPDTMPSGYEILGFPDDASGSVQWLGGGGLILQNKDSFNTATVRYAISGVIVQTSTLGIIAGAVDA